MVSLAGIIGNNSIGYMHKHGKVDRAILASANRLLDQVLLKKEEFQRLEIEDNKFINVLWGTPDLVRLNRCFEYIAFGLHRHYFKQNFHGSVTVLPGYLREKSPNKKQFVKFIQDRLELELQEKPKLGFNPEVFYYQVSDPDRFGLYSMRTCFYGGLPVYIAFKPERLTLPEDLAFLLVEQGIRTIFTLGDNTYEFNPAKEK